MKRHVDQGTDPYYSTWFILTHCITSRPGLVYDTRMCGHENGSNPHHPETPDRIVRIWETLCSRGLVERCTRVEVGEGERGGRRGERGRESGA